MKPIIYLSLLFSLGVLSSAALANVAEKSKNKATKAQTEEWIEQHIQAWDDDKKIFVTAKDCKIQFVTKDTSSIINMAGLLFPIEVIAIGNSRSPIVRVRVKDRYTGDYGMKKECPNNSDLICENSSQKWEPLSYYDLTITHVLEYFGRDENLNDRKASSLRNAISHYAQICGAKEYEYSF